MLQGTNLANDGSRITVSDQGGRPKHSRRYVGLLLGILCFMVALPLAIIGFSKLTNNSSTNSPKEHKKVKINNSLPASQQAEQQMYNGNYDAAQELLKAEVAKTTDLASQTKLYAQLATNGINSKQFADARMYALEAERLKPTPGTAQLIGYVAEKAGDKSTARKYYELALRRLDKNDPAYAISAGDYESALKRVSK